MASFDRRTLITGALAVAGAAALPRNPLAATALPASLRFSIIRNNKLFGQCQIGFVTSGNVLTITSDVTMSQRIANISVFSYHHHCVETWSDGRFAEMHSSTQRDKSDRQDVTAVRTPSGVKIMTSHGPDIAASDANPLTHWNPAVLSGPLINPQDGRPVEVITRQLGRDGFTQASGAPIAGNHWVLRGSQTLDEWYDDAGIWAGLRGVLPDKSVVEYRRA
jgi:hypothetical protein